MFTRVVSSPLAIVAAALLALAIAAPEAHAGVRVGDRASEFIAVKDGGGRRVKLKSYRGKVVVVTFGASWCKPCKAELPAWEKLAKKYKKKGVVFIAVNIDKDTAKGRKFIRQAKLSAVRAAYEPTGATVESYDPPTMPSTFVVGKRGLVRYLHKGYRKGDAAKLAKQLDKQLAK